MDHSHMDHGHGDMDMGHGNHDMCNMNMLFTWDTNNLCIIFRSWHVRGTTSLIASLLGVILLTAGYELVREMSRRYEVASQRWIDGLPHEYDATELRVGEQYSLLRWSTGRSKGEAEGRSKVVKALFYAVQVFYSFFIMLLFMSYNGWVMLAVAVGAFIGYLAFGNGGSTKSVACH